MKAVGARGIHETWCREQGWLALSARLDASTDYVWTYANWFAWSQSLFSFLPPDGIACPASSGAAALPCGAALRLGFRHSLQELQERQSPMRSPRGRASFTPLVSRESSGAGRTRLCGDAPGLPDATAPQQLLRQQRRSPVRQAARRRPSSHSISPVSSCRRRSAAIAHAALAAADAAAAASPIKTKGRAFAPVGTPNARKAVQGAERELRSLAFSGGEAACDSCTAPMSQDAP